MFQNIPDQQVCKILPKQDTEKPHHLLRQIGKHEQRFFLHSEFHIMENHSQKEEAQCHIKDLKYDVINCKGFDEGSKQCEKPAETPLSLNVSLKHKRIELKL